LTINISKLLPIPNLRKALSLSLSLSFFSGGKREKEKEKNTQRKALFEERER